MVAGSGPNTSHGSKSKKKAAMNEFIGFKVDSYDQISTRADDSINIISQSNNKSND